MGTGHTWVTYPVGVHCKGTPPPVILLLRILLPHIWDDCETHHWQATTTRSTTINVTDAQIYLHVWLELSLHLADTIMELTLVCLPSMINKPYHRTYHRCNSCFHDKNKFLNLKQNKHCFDDFSNVRWCMKETSVWGLLGPLWPIWISIQP